MSGSCACREAVERCAAARGVSSTGMFHEMVTLVELLSPANNGGNGRSYYMQKQNELLATDMNLVEIDLSGRYRVSA